MTPLPPKYRGQGAVGKAPRPKRGAVEPAERHRCHVCGEIGTGRVEALIGGRKSDRWTCPPCLEGLGQTSLLGGEG